MKLTFRGFLQRYCRELSGLETDNLRKLCHAAAGEAPRTAEPLFLLALEKGMLRHLLDASRGSRLEGEYGSLAAKAAPYECNAQGFLENEDVPERYAKVLQAYVAERDAIEADRRISALMREKTLAAMEARGITRYRLCKDLGLNVGNAYAYLSKGDTTKVSKETARRIMQYACS